METGDGPRAASAGCAALGVSPFPARFQGSVSRSTRSCRDDLVVALRIYAAKDAGKVTTGNLVAEVERAQRTGARLPERRCAYL